uniref:Uncharacterized protein n=1 Tax=Rhizophora mucronata TaxID=61149 RepID=A0A2P2K4M5_RHIMU
MLDPFSFFLSCFKIEDLELLIINIWTNCQTQTSIMCVIGAPCFYSSLIS